MVRTIRERVTVQEGGRIEIPSSALPAGARADVVVVLQSQGNSGGLRDLIGKGRGCYATPEEADQFIRGERDAWES